MAIDYIYSEKGNVLAWFKKKKIATHCRLMSGTLGVEEWYRSSTYRHTHTHWWHMFRWSNAHIPLESPCPIEYYRGENGKMCQNDPHPYNCNGALNLASQTMLKYSQWASIHPVHFCFVSLAGYIPEIHTGQKNMYVWHGVKINAIHISCKCMAFRPILYMTGVG